MKVNLGAGHRKLEGYIGVDIHPHADVQCDILDLPKEWTGKVSEVLVVHALEHLGFYDTQRALLEWKRVLCPGGLLAIECPNLHEACLSYLKDPKNISYGLYPIYGDQRGEHSIADITSVHKSGWVPESLIAELQKAGFRSARQAPAEHKFKEPRDFRVEAVK